MDVGKKTHIVFPWEAQVLLDLFFLSLFFFSPFFFLLFCLMDQIFFYCIFFHMCSSTRAITDLQFSLPRGFQESKIPRGIFHSIITLSETDHDVEQSIFMKKKKKRTVMWHNYPNQHAKKFLLLSFLRVMRPFGVMLHFRRLSPAR